MLFLATSASTQAKHSHLALSRRCCGHATNRQHSSLPWKTAPFRRPQSLDLSRRPGPLQIRIHPFPNLVHDPAPVGQFCSVPTSRRPAVAKPLFPTSSKQEGSIAFDKRADERWCRCRSCTIRARFPDAARTGRGPSSATSSRDRLRGAAGAPPCWRWCRSRSISEAHSVILPLFDSGQCSTKMATLRSCIPYGPSMTVASRSTFPSGSSHSAVSATRRQRAPPRLVGSMMVSGASRQQQAT
jgi:hypothetical protein